MGMGTVLIVVMVVMMIVMMGGMVAGRAWAIVKRRRGHDGD